MGNGHMGHPPCKHNLSATSMAGRNDLINRAVVLYFTCARIREINHHHKNVTTKLTEKYLVFQVLKERRVHTGRNCLKCLNRLASHASRQEHWHVLVCNYPLTDSVWMIEVQVYSCLVVLGHKTSH